MIPADFDPLHSSPIQPQLHPLLQTYRTHLGRSCARRVTACYLEGSLALGGEGKGKSSYRSKITRAREARALIQYVLAEANRR